MDWEQAGEDWPPCDRCGLGVEPHNDASIVAFIVTHDRLPNPIELLAFAEARHLFPTAKCRGSPSRAQYLGGMRDTRYPFDTSFGRQIQHTYRSLYDALGLMVDERTWPRVVP